MKKKELVHLPGINIRFAYFRCEVNPGICFTNIIYMKRKQCKKISLSSFQKETYC